MPLCTNFCIVYILSDFLCSSITVRLYLQLSGDSISSSPVGTSTVRFFYICSICITDTHTQGTTQVGQYQRGKTNLDFTEARDSQWQWHQLGHMQVCTLLQTDNHASTPPLSFLQARCPSCRPTNSMKALKAIIIMCYTVVNFNLQI